jgi:hypothetical protein
MHGHEEVVVTLTFGDCCGAFAGCGMPAKMVFTIEINEPSLTMALE